MGACVCACACVYLGTPQDWRKGEGFVHGDVLHFSTWLNFATQIITTLDQYHN